MVFVHDTTDVLTRTSDACMFTILSHHLRRCVIFAATLVELPYTIAIANCDICGSSLTRS